MVRKILLALIVIGALARCYDITAPWKRKDHYNYGGVHTAKFVECMRTLPLEQSHGIVYDTCEKDRMLPYPNHPPTLILAMIGWQDLWHSQAEWTLRSFVILFSWLNIFLVFQIASLLRPQTLFPYFAAAIQSLTLGGLYFGSHPDFICEFAVFFPLLASYLHLRGKEHRAGFATVIGGLASWPGFLYFAGQLGHHWLLKKKTWRIILWGAIGGACGLALMMWLRQTANIGEFLTHKLANPGYVDRKWTGIAYVIEWIHTFFQYHANYLTPFFLLCVGLELIAKTQGKRWTRDILALIALIGGGGILYVILGREYVYIHAFLYLYLFPLYSLLAAHWLMRCLEGKSEALFSKRWWLVLLAIFLLANYPFGRLQSNFYHDVVNSLGLIGVVILFFFYFWRGHARLSEKQILTLLILAGVTNISQMINYRNEPPTDYDFCQKARFEYEQTGQPVPSDDSNFTRDFYCQGTPLQSVHDRPDGDH